MSQHLQEPVFKPKNVPAKNAQNPLEILASLFLKANLLLYLLPPYITQTYITVQLTAHGSLTGLPVLRTLYKPMSMHKSSNS